MCKNLNFGDSDLALKLLREDCDLCRTYLLRCDRPWTDSASIQFWKSSHMTTPSLAELPKSLARATSLISQSPEIRRIVEQLPKLGRCNAPVLLLGETGTGKEVIAHAIHNFDQAGPFVTVDCSSLVGPLMESELFGHVKGSFTGAQVTKIGLIELADGGTVFLDEIGELPLELQAKLLRVIQQKEIRPVGSLVSRKVNFRVIAATNRNLAREVEQGRFRSDLFYRLNVVKVRLPPLRERKLDIPLLLGHFLERYGRRHSLTYEAQEALQAYDWPGNVRELENCVLQMVALNSGPLLHTADLPSSVQNHTEAQRSAYMAIAAAVQQGPTMVIAADANQPMPIKPSFSLEEIERRTILDALEYTKDDRVMASHLLGIGRTTLYRKLKEYGKA